MKQTKKTALLIAAVLIAVGLVISVGALASVKFDVSRLNTGEFTTNTYDMEKDFQNIYIQAEDYDIRLVPSSDNRCKVICQEGRDIVCSVSVEGDTLVIEQRNQRDWREFIDFSWGERELTVYLPRIEYGKCHLESLSGDLELHNVTAEAIEAKTVSGDIECFHVIAREKMEMESTSGEIELTRSDAAAMNLETVSGDIEGTLLSGKEFDIETVSGEVMVPPSGTGGSCRIKTVSGDVEMEIRN